MSFWEKMGPKEADAGTDIGNVLLRLGCLTEDGLRQAVQQQVADRPHPLLGEVLVAQGAITKEQLDEALRIQQQMRSGNKTVAMLDVLARRLDALLAHARTP